MSDDVLSTRFGRRATRGVLLGLSAPRLVAVGAAVAVAVAALAAANLAGLGLSAIVWAPAAAIAFVRVKGRPAVEWAATTMEFFGRRASGQTQYRAQLAVRPRPAGTLALPGDAARLRVHLDPESGAAMVHDPHRQTLAAVVSVSHPAFVLLDRDEQAQRVSRWGRLQAGLANSETVAAVQVLEAVVPDLGDGPAQWYEDHGAHRGRWADEQYSALLERTRLGSSSHRTTVSLALDLKGAGRTVRAAGGGLRGAAALLRQDMVSLADGLTQAGLTVGCWLDEPDLAAIIRCAYDPAVSLAGTDPAANLAHAGPLAVSEGWDRLRHDSGWSSVLWMSEWPRVEVPADFLHPLLFAPGVRRTFSMTSRPVPTDRALRQLRREKTEALADQTHKARVGQVADLSDHQEYQDLLERERSVIAGHTDVEFTGLVTVTAPTPEELDAARASIQRAAASTACELRPLYGRQLQGFALGALPLARDAF